MSATDQAPKTSGGQPIPQWYDPTINDYAPATGTEAHGGYVQSNESLSLTNRSVAGAGAVATPAAANTSRKYLLIQAPDTNSDDVWISLVGTATAASPSIQVKPGGGFEWTGLGRCPNGALSVLVGSGDALTVWEG